MLQRNSMIELHINYSDDDIPPGMNEERVRTICAHAARHTEQEGEIDISFVTRDIMKDLNSTYRGKDDSTDILSFATFDDEDGFPSPESDSYLGELIISAADVLDNCSYFSVDPDNELIRILVHGLLHLKGYDHETSEETEPMLVLQEQIVVQIEKELEV